MRMQDAADVSTLPDPDHPRLRWALLLALFGGALGVLTPIVFFTAPATPGEEFWWAGAIAFVSVGASLLAIAQAGRVFLHSRRQRWAGPLLVSGFATLAGAVGPGFLFALFRFLDHLDGAALLPWGGGGAWGRPLRVRGRQLHPALRVGSDWTRGERPRVDGLDAPTCAALEALWLHDAQKEHASVPAFARISWLLAAVGAPAELMERAHVAGLEEIDHARRCFALAAGYGGRTHTVEPMPDLLLGALDVRGDPRVLLAVESLTDGCLLEDFNADVAAACAAVCEDPAARDVLQRIAREERSHAELSWDLLAWALAAGGAPVRAAVHEALGRLEGIARPTAVSGDKAALLAAADPARLRAHGRLPDPEWARLWAARLVATRERADRLGATRL
jgi:hypothetical protein